MKGARIAYSAEELRFVRARCALPRREIHAAFVARFGRTDVGVDNIKQLCTREGWASGRERWGLEDDARLRELYSDTPTADVAARLGRTPSSVYRRADHFGLRKSEAYLASPAACRLRRGDNVGAPHRFAKGHAPANKGLRRPGWTAGRMKETQFKKGERQGIAVSLYKPIGTERVSKDGYIERKIHDDLPLQSRWRAVHRIRWEEINGPVPKGMALKCLGDKRNTDPSNWIAVPRGMLPRLNGKHGRDYDGAPVELKPAIMAIAKLERAARASTR